MQAPRTPFAADPPLPSAGAIDRIRGRLLRRSALSRAAARPMLTLRRERLPGEPLAEGVEARWLYRHDSSRSARAGEPLRARLIELAPGSTWQGPRAPDVQREWLLLRGTVTLGGECLNACDYHVDPAGSADRWVGSGDGALLFLRESIVRADTRDVPFTLCDAAAGWPEFAPGIQRRVLWQRDGQAALLYRAQPGAAVPRHGHGHDEECLMVRGELFLDDVLLRQGDYQLAPAGTGHQVTATDTGAVVYAHGDLELQVLTPA